MLIIHQREKEIMKNKTQLKQKELLELCKLEQSILTAGKIRRFSVDCVEDIGHSDKVIIISGEEQ